MSYELATVYVRALHSLQEHPDVAIASFSKAVFDSIRDGKHGRVEIEEPPEFTSIWKAAAVRLRLTR